MARLNGTGGSDLLIGTAEADTAVGGAGNDLVVASGGADVAYGNTGADTLFGNGGDDTLFGGQGNDTVFGGQGRDLVFGDLGNDVLFGDLGDDTVYGNLGNDMLYGNGGDDVLYGGQGDDTLFGGQGNDVLFGDLGNDVLSGDLGDDTAVFSGGRFDYAITRNADGSFTLVGATGTTRVSGVEQFRFRDGTVLAPFLVRDDDSGGGGGGPPPQALNAPPVNAVPDGLSVEEDAAVPIPGLSISDVDAGTGTLTTTLTVTNGTLAVAADEGGATISGGGSAVVTLTGTLAQINASLGGVTYQGDEDFVGGDTLTVTTNDGGNTGAGGAQSDTDTVAINVGSGGDVNFTYYFPERQTVFNGPGNGDYFITDAVEIQDIADEIGSLDFQIDRILLDFGDEKEFFTTANFNGLVITDLNNAYADFRNTAFVQNLLVGFDPATDVTATENTLTINFSGVGFTPASTLEITFPQTQAG